MAGSVRADMAAKGLPCEAVRKLVSNRALEEDRGATDPVRVHARNAAASLLVEAGDEWMPGDSGTTFAGVRIGGPLIWSRIVPVGLICHRHAVGCTVWAQLRSISAHQELACLDVLRKRVRYS